MANTDEQGVTLLWKKTLAFIDTLELDASLSEGHKGAVEVTEEPVEQGVNITDHRRRKADVVTIEGIVSNTPLPDPTSVTFTQTFNGQAFQSRSAYEAGTAETAYETLLDLLDSPNLITVVTALRTYTNMTMVSLDVPRDAKTGDALRFTAVLQEIKVVQNATVQVQATTPRAQKKKDLGKKAATPTTSDETLAHFGKRKINAILNSPDPAASLRSSFGIGNVHL